jgi:hypothetical protein
MSEIVWRKDIANAPGRERVLMIATPIVPSHDGTMPEIVVAHWYVGTEQWVIADTFGESRRETRLELNLLAHAPCSPANSLIQSASYPRSASNIAPDFRSDSSSVTSRLSWASPVVSSRRTGNPLVSTQACIVAGRVRPKALRQIAPWCA